MVTPLPNTETMPVYQLKVTLIDSEPEIWRRFCVPATIRLGQLHKVLQRVMGWTNSHLHAFHLGDDIYQVPYPGFDDLNIPGERCCHDERKFVLGSLLERPRQMLRYEYDFGDGWEHEIVLEKSCQGPASTVPSAWPEKMPARRKTAAASAATTTCSKPWPIPSTRITPIFSSGSEAPSIPKPSIFRASIEPSRRSSPDFSHAPRSHCLWPVQSILKTRHSDYKPSEPAVICPAERVIGLYNENSGDTAKRIAKKVRRWFISQAEKQEWAGVHFLNEVQSNHGAGCILWRPPEKVDVKITITKRILVLNASSETE